MKPNTRQTKTFIGVMALAAISSTAYASQASHALHPAYALAILALAAATSRMKIKLPGIDGNMSVNLPFLLMAVVNLSALEAVLIACVSTVMQCWPKQGSKFKPEQMLFNVSMMAFATGVANLIWNAGWPGRAAWASEPLMLALATAAFFVGQTAPVAGIIKLAEGAAMRRIWLSIVQLSFPYYVVSAGMASMVKIVSHHFGWPAALVVFPVMYGIHHSYQLYFGRAAEGCAHHHWPERPARERKRDPKAVEVKAAFRRRPLHLVPRCVSRCLRRNNRSFYLASLHGCFRKINGQI